jgi:hypothetical protein
MTNIFRSIFEEFPSTGSTVQTHEFKKFKTNCDWVYQSSTAIQGSRMFAIVMSSCHPNAAQPNVAEKVIERK